MAPNTPDFEEWAFNLMLDKANEIREKWQLPIPVLTPTNVLFDLKATLFGFDGSIDTPDGRFAWYFGGNTLDKFLDTKYSSQSFAGYSFASPGAFIERYDEEGSRLAKIKSKITAREALSIARESLHRLGLTEKQLDLVEPPEVTQYKYEPVGGGEYPLPLFLIGWRTKQSVKEFSQSSMQIVLRFEISGITGRVADYFVAASKTPRVLTPKNYYEMLGVKPPRNRRQEMGLEPLDKLKTNSPPAVTNANK